MRNVEQLSEGVQTTLTKLFLALSGGNILVAFGAILDLVPAIASLVSLMFLTWIGFLTVRERKLSIRIKKMTIADKEQKREQDLVTQAQLEALERANQMGDKG